MMFTFFRVLLIIFSLAQFLLAIFAFVSSYKNESFLNNSYLIDYHVSYLNLTNLFGVESTNSKRFDDTMFIRDLPILVKYDDGDNAAKFVISSSTVATAATATGTATIVGDNAIKFVVDDEAVNKALTLITVGNTLATATQLATGTISTTQATGISTSTSTIDTSNGFYTTVNQVFTDIANQLNYRDLGLADVYSFSFWGYCRGYTANDTTESDGQTRIWDNSNVNWTYCTPPVANFKFDPIQIFQDEIVNMINGDVKGGVDVPQLSTVAINELKVLAENLNSETLNLPGDLDDKVGTIQNMNSAGFVMLIMVVVFGFISCFVQTLAFCMSPHNCCLTFMNFLFQVIIFIFSLVTAALITATYTTGRASVNKDTDVSGVMSYLSINLYAFIWSSTVAALLVIVFSFLGHCVGMFGTGRRRYRTVPYVQPDYVSVVEK